MLPTRAPPAGDHAARSHALGRTDPDRFECHRDEEDLSENVEGAIRATRAIGSRSRPPSEQEAVARGSGLPARRGPEDRFELLEEAHETLEALDWGVRSDASLMRNPIPSVDVEVVTVLWLPW